MTAPSPRRQTPTSNASERTFAKRSEPSVRVIDVCRARTCAMAVVRQRVSPRTIWSADRRDECLPGIERGGLEFVELADAIDDVRDRRIGCDAMGDLRQRLP